MARKRDRIIKVGRSLASGGPGKESAAAAGTGVGIYWIQMWLARTWPTLFTWLGGWAFPIAQLYIGHKMTRSNRGAKTRAAGHALLGIAGMQIGAKIFGGGAQQTAGVDDTELVMLTQGGDTGGLQGETTQKILDVGGLQGAGTQQYLDVGSYEGIGG